MKRYLRYIGLLGIILGIVYQVWFFCNYGKASIFTTLALYTAAGLIGFGIIQLAFSYRFQQDAKLLLFTILSLLFLGELGLKYVFQVGLSYSERNGSFYYISRYPKSGQLEEMKRTGIDLYSKTGPKDTSILIQRPEYSFLHSYNKWGFREREPELFQDTSDFLILTLGDSFTEGMGAHQDSTWGRLFEQKLNQHFEKNQFFTLNAAAMGSDPVYEYKKLETIGNSLSLDLVILTINSLDLRDIYFRRGMERFDLGTQFPEGPNWEIFYASSYLFRAFMHGVLGYNGFLLSQTQWEKEKKKAEEVLINTIIKTEQLAQAQGAKFLLVIRPQLSEILSGQNALSELKHDLSQKHTLDMLDLSLVFQENQLITPQNADDFFWPIDRHFNQQGNNLWADQLMIFLIQAGYFE